MAAPRENLLSLGHLTGTDRETFNTFTNRKEHSLKKSLNRSMTLQADFSTHQSSQHLRMKHLQQHWQELKERERAAQQHNKQLLQQFEEAQDALREMMARTAAMKTIRIEYERYLEESSPRWEQQFKEKTEAAQRKRIDEYLKTCLENTEEQVTKSSVDQPLLSQAQTKKPQKFSAPQEYHRQNSHSNYNQYEALHSTWLTRSQPHTFRFPVRVPYQPQVSSQAPPSFLPHPHPFHLQHLAPTPGHHHPQPGQNPPGWASSQPDHSWFWASGGAGMPSGYEALLGQLYMAQPPHDRGVAPVVAEEAETSRAPRPKTDRGGGSRSSDSSQELDIKPVRLSSGHAGSSESGRDSSQVSRQKKKKKREKRGREQRTSSETESCSSQESSRTSSAIVVALAAAAQTLGSEASSEKGSSSSKKTRRRIEDVVAESPRMEKVVKEKNRSRGDVHESPSKESHCTGEESEESRIENDGNQSPVEKSESCRDESECQRDEGSGSVSIQLENGDPDKSAEQESSSSKQSGAGQKVVEGTGHKTELEDGEEDDEESGEDEEPNSQRDELQEDRGVEDDDVSAGKNAIVEEEETGAEDEMEEDMEEEEEEESDEDQRDDEEQSDKLRNKDDEVRKQASSQDEEVDEDESEESEDKREDDDDDDDDGGSDEDGSGEEDNEQSSDKAEVVEEKDSDDSIISPQENRPRKINIIPEESAEDNDEMDGNKTGSSNDDLNEISDEDDVEDLLAPQTQTKKTEEKVPKTEEEPKVCDKVEIFQLTSSKSDLQSDSDEFDHFYD